MVKSELARDLSQRTRLPLSEVQEAIDRILDLLADGLEQGERVEIRDFGAFQLSVRPGRMGRNPKTGTDVTVPSMRYVRFRAGKLLNELVQENFLKAQRELTE